MQKSEEEHRSILGESGVADLLLLLLERGELVASQLRLVNRNYAKIVSVARELELRGLVMVKMVRSPRVTHIYRLTLKGKKVAEKLKDAKEIIGG